MKSILVVGEDSLCCALGEQLVRSCMSGWALAQPPISKRGRSHLFSALSRFAEQAQFVQPVLCVADTDNDCAKELLSDWLPRGATNDFLFRLAVTEAESWALGDADAFAESFAVPQSKIPQRPDELTDAKRTVLDLARRSKRRQIRQEVVSNTDPSKPGTGYNEHLCAFVQLHWRAKFAATRSPSLARAVRRLDELDMRRK